MTTEEQLMLLNLSRKLITELTSELNTELNKIQLTTSAKDKEEVFSNCEGIIAKIKYRISQLDK